MDPPPATANLHSYPLPPLSNAKLRLMCSYGGHIVPRTHDKSLCYASGDTRIVAVDRRTSASTLSAFTGHLSRILYNNRPFTLKYQLPNEDLDSLISVTTDEDLHNMLEEHDRIANSPTPSRIRLFIFPSNPESVGSAFLDQKAESWFCDALKSTRIMQRGHSADSAMGNGLMGLDCMGPTDSSLEAQLESLSNSGEAKHGSDFGSVPESMVLETNSSFGSTNSSTSKSNLPPIRIHGEDGGVNFQDKNIKLASAGPNESDNSVASVVSYVKTGIYQDQVIHVTSLDTKVSSNNVESESIISDTSSIIQKHKTIQVPGYQLSHQSDCKQHQQDLQYVPVGGHYTPLYATGPLPISSYYPLYHPLLHQQQHSPYQPSHPYPIYLLPVRPTQSYNMSVPCNVNETATVASSGPSLHPHTAMITTRVAYTEIAAAPTIPELATEVYRMVPPATPLDIAPSNQNQQQFMVPPEMYHPSQSVATASMATASYDNEFDDDLAYAQIYKSQPPAPTLPQHQTTTKAAAVLLSEVPSQLHTNDAVKQQVGTAQP